MYDFAPTHAARGQSSSLSMLDASGKVICMVSRHLQCRAFEFHPTLMRGGCCVAVPYLFDLRHFAVWGQGYAVGCDEIRCDMGWRGMCWVGWIVRGCMVNPGDMCG